MRGNGGGDNSSYFAASMRRVLFASLAVLLTGCLGAKPLSPPGGWEQIRAGAKTKCARGGPYSFWLRKAASDKLVIFFQGGGGCFDKRTCAPGSTWFDDRIDSEDVPSKQQGILALDDKDNPFRDWSFLYIPSCTGDVHIGDARVRYGSTVVEQRGWQNAHAALERAFEEFSPRHVLVTGCSAGSVGSAWFTEEIVEAYPYSNVTQVGDSLAYLFHRPISVTGWGADKHYPKFFGVGKRRWTMEQFLARSARAHPRATYARFNHADDAVQRRFYEALGGDPAKFQGQLRAVEERLKKLKNYRSYLACGTGHCAFTTAEFGTLEVEGVPLRDWVSDLAKGRDVSCPTCR